MISDFRDMLINSPQGQRALAHLEERFHVKTSTAVVDLQGRSVTVVDRETQLFNEGQRSVIPYMVGLAEADASKVEKDFHIAAVPEEYDIGV